MHLRTMLNIYFDQKKVTNLSNITSLAYFFWREKKGACVQACGGGEEEGEGEKRERWGRKGNSMTCLQKREDERVQS